MKYLIKILITLLLLEVALGYIYYIRDSTRLTGNYISSTLRVIDRLMLEQKQELDAQAKQIKILCEDACGVLRDLSLTTWR